MECDDSILGLESVTRFQLLSLSRQKRLLVSSYPSFLLSVYPLVRLSACTHAVPPGRIFMKFGTGGFNGNLSEKKSNFLEKVKIIGRFS